MRLMRRDRPKTYRDLICLFLTGVLVLWAGHVAWAQAPDPKIDGVQPTADGYMLSGSGFGRDQRKLQVFEGATEVTTKVTYRADNVIAMRSQPTGTVQHRVVVAGQESKPFRFTHATATAPRPTVDRIDPSSGAQGDPVSVNIYGRNLSGASVNVGRGGVTPADRSQWRQVNDGLMVPLQIDRLVG